MNSNITRGLLAAAIALAACSNNQGNADSGQACPGGCPVHETCVSGSCQCITGWASCKTPDGGSACTEVLADPHNCGACGQSCASGESCLNGTCQCTAVLCDGGVCSDLQSDPQNCGACGLICAPNEQCVGALCTCPNGFTLCGLVDGGQVCTDLSSDPNNCGQCAGACDGGDCVCDPVTQTCAPPVPGAPGVCTCNAQYSTQCGSACVDPNSDPQNCGGCGNVCPTGNCAGGICACSSPFTKCPGNVCADLSTDPHHCGQCGTDCTLLGVAGAACQNGVCACGLDGGTGTVCQSGNSPACVDESSDPQNCGKCGSVCAFPTTACASGNCACPAQEQLCGSGGSQACVNTASDALNCGGCGYDCGANYAADAGCIQGHCGCSDVQTLCLTSLSPLACGCEASGACAQPRIAFSDVAPIFNDGTSLLGCAASGCHSASSAMGGLDLSTPLSAYMGLVGLPDAGPSGNAKCDGGPNGAFGDIPSSVCPCTARVIPGDPADSYLIQVLRDSAFCAAGRPMPIDLDGGFHPLSGCQVQLITQWVQQGAVGP